MTTTGCFIKGVHPHAFRSGEAGLITGVKVITLGGEPIRPCYEVTYPDGFIDLVLLSDVGHGHYIIGELDKI